MKFTVPKRFFYRHGRQVTPIRELDNRTIGAGKRGPITEKIQTLFFNCVKGKAKNHENWLTLV